MSGSKNVEVANLPLKPYVTMRKIYLVTAAVVILLAIGVLAGHVGGVSIRNTASQPRGVSLSLSQPVVRGVPVLVRWEASNSNKTGNVNLFFRDSQEEIIVGQGSLDGQQSRIVLPCDTDGNSGAVVMRLADSKEVIATTSVELLPSGPECAGGR